jgi:hypothetical protein
VKRRRIIQGAGVDRELIVFSDFTTMNEAAAIRAEVAHRIPAAGGFGRKRLRSAGEPYRLARKSDKRYEARAGCLAAIGATAKSGKLRLSLRFVTRRTAEAAARPTLHAVAHMFPPFVNCALIEKSYVKHDFDRTRQSHKSTLCRCYRGVGLAGRKIKHMNDRAADVFLPCEKDQVIAYGDSLIGNRVGETDTVTCDNCYRELAFRTNSDPRREGRERDLKYLADSER